jgi:hypothetical protein
VKRVKLRVRSIKRLGWVLCVKSGIFVGGFPGNLQDTKEFRKIKGLHRDLFANLPTHLLPLDRTGAGEPVGLVAMGAGTPGG